MKNVIGIILPISGFIFLISLVLTIVPAFGADFEFGTQFGISRLIPDDSDYSSSITYTQIPSSFFYLGSSPTVLYATWFPSTQFAIGPEFSFGRISISDEYLEEEENETLTTLHLGGHFAYFLQNHTVSTPYLLGRFSRTIFSGEDTLLSGENQTLTSIGIGLGYQWRIGPAFVLRTKAQYQRVFVKDEGEDANEFSLIIGIGTRFRNKNVNTSDVSNRQ